MRNQKNIGKPSSPHGKRPSASGSATLCAFTGGLARRIAPRSVINNLPARLAEVRGGNPGRQMNRILDANLNRAAEALRVLEESARFVLADASLAAALRDARHRLCRSLSARSDELLAARDTCNDPGAATPSAPVPRHELAEIISANSKRLQQALRVLAEYGADTGVTAGFESLRYEAYTLEQRLHMGLKHLKKAALLAGRRLYLVTNSDAFGDDAAFLGAVESALRGGVDILQLREKKRPVREILRLGAELRRLCAGANALFIVNDRVDVALALEADGVHLGQDDMELSSARRLLPDGAIIGLSTHEPKQALAAVESGADYIGVGPIFATPTKPGRAAAGVDYARWVAENLPGKPAFAIGGIHPGNLPDVLATGARRVAVVRSVMNAPSPEIAARELRHQLDMAGV
ncbi:MAG: thiamine phosphate synthase [Puniceicoccales bacterium]|jgi:thiamine-phosphate pyrophosphorylase|nr:thiamine phosphate synthase [Puniceicoccales bacterium]